MRFVSAEQNSLTHCSNIYDKMRQRLIIFSLLLLVFTSCQKKKEAEQVIQRTDGYVPAASSSDIDTTQAYLSPTDRFSDRSPLNAGEFQNRTLNFRGKRGITYSLMPLETENLIVVQEYMNGIRSGGDSAATATRVLLYADSVLLYRKAFPLEFSDAVRFASVRKFEFHYIPVTKAKGILYYWFDISREDGTNEQEYHAVSVDREGITNELSGDFSRIGREYASIRFQNDYRLKAKVRPGEQYASLSIDLIFTIDWKLCTAALEIPEDTIFIVSDQPTRFFNSRIKLYVSPEPRSSFRETRFRRLTEAKILRMFVPSYFDNSQRRRDRLFIEFNRTTSGWIDDETMRFEEILAEN